jgi:steroid delta-isomerase-like uncharacterized protein
MALWDEARRARLTLALEHIRAENAHDLERVMETFGEEPWLIVNGEAFRGRDNVRGLYESVFRAFPDARFDVKHQHVSDDAVIFEIVLSGTHEGAWLGVPASGRRLEITDCVVLTFDHRGKLAGERVYFDEASLLRQLGGLPGA